MLVKMIGFIKLNKLELALVLPIPIYIRKERSRTKVDLKQHGALQLLEIFHSL